MSDNKNYTLIKVAPQDVLFDIHPVSNMGLTRRIHLTSRNTKQALPKDWALGVFQDEGVFQMYKQGIFTFDDNDSIVKEAFAAGVYFDEALDFTPADVKQNDKIYAILKTGNRVNILKAIETYSADTVKNVAIQNLKNLTQGVISMLESTLNTQLVLDER